MNLSIHSLWKTHKAIGVDEIINDALKEKVDTLSVISSGNYARILFDTIKERSLGNKLKLVNIVNKSLDVGCSEVFIKGNRILRDANEREEYVRENFPKSGNVKDYTDFHPKAYLEVAREIVRFDPVFKSFPSYVSIGVGSGKFFISLAQAIREAKIPTKLIGFLPKGENGVFNDDNLVERKSLLYFKEFNAHSLADKLSCPYTSFKQELLNTQNEGHILVEARNYDFLRAYETAKYWRTYGEPSACAGFIVDDIDIRKRLSLSEEGRSVVVHTGYGEGSRERYRRIRIPAEWRRNMDLKERVGTERCI